MRWNIRYQLFSPLVILLLGVVGISTWTALAAADGARRHIEEQVRDVFRTLREADFPLTPHVLDLLRGLSGAEYLLADQEGNCLAATLPVESSRLPAMPAIDNNRQALRLGARLVIGERSYFCNGLGLRPSQGTVGNSLYILYPESLWRDAQWQAVRPSLLLGAFGGVASILLAVGSAQRLSRRIQDLERRTRKIAGGDFSRMELPGRDDELRDLGRSINDMAQRLAQLQHTMQQTERLRLLGQVSGGLAHQLRNGVSGARLAVQLHARECKGIADQEALDVALRQLALVETNLKRFLDLGRTEGLRQERCSLTDLIGETVALLRPHCQHVHVDLRWQAPLCEVTVVGDPGQLAHMLFNIVSNGMEAAGPGGWVALRVQKVRATEPADNQEWCQVVIADSGPGPPANVADHLFELFVSSKPEGVGLGLAVARQIVLAHHGIIDWQREGDQTVFRIRLPLGIADR
jgi:signal transduction histidine kinase